MTLRGRLTTPERWLADRRCHSARKTSRFVDFSTCARYGLVRGLAGIRAGFVLAAPALADALRDALGAWTVSGPARHAVAAAFADIAWQREMRERLHRDGARLAASIAIYGFDVRATPLFAWTATPKAPELQHALALRGIWTRLFDPPGMTPSLRIGLPGAEGDWARLSLALREICA